MIRLKHNQFKLTSETITWLENATRAISQAKISHAEKVELATRLWKNKNKSAFADIRQNLKKSSSENEKCWYCEANELSVIDHIAPKSKFPAFAFAQDNLIFACDQCNTHHKKDQFAVFHPALSVQSYALKTGQNKAAPPSEDFAFILPHLDDPLELLFLNLKLGHFSVNPNCLSDPRKRAKAENTLLILALNERVALKRDRKNAFHVFETQLRRYQDIQATTNAAELLRLIPIPDGTIEEATFLRSKRRALRQQKKRILQSSHITVLHEMKRQADNIPDLKRFEPLITQILG